MKRTLTGRPFTMVEMITVIAIIGVLAALLLGGLARARANAGYTRWLAFSADLAKDPTLDTYYTFVEGVGETEIKNRAVGDPTSAAYDPTARDGELKNVNCWVDKGGRWRKKPTVEFYGGSSDEVAMKGFYTQNSLGELTVCAWIRTESTSPQPIVSFDPDKAWEISLTGSGSFRFTSRSSSGTANVTADEPELNDDRWHFVAAVYDYDLDLSEGNRVRLYIDGGQVPAANMTGPAHNPHGGNKLGDTGTGRYYGYIGVESNATSFDGSTGSDRFEGKIDEVAIFHRVLSDGEIGDMYRSGLPAAKPD